MTSHDRLDAAAKRYGWKAWPQHPGAVHQNGTTKVTVSYNRLGQVVFAYADHGRSGSHLRIRGGVGAISNYMKFYRAKGD